MSDALVSQLKTLGLEPEFEEHEDLEGPCGSVLSLVIESAQAFRAWESCFAARQELGYYPLLLGGLAMVEENFDMNECYELDFKRALKRVKAKKIDPWLEKRGDLHTRHYGVTAKLPESSRKASFHFLKADSLRLGFVPTTESWHCPLVLGFGGWNDCPEAEIHAALARRWEADYGAHLVALTGSVLEYRVERPPDTAQAALELAQQHFAYCSDIVTQGTEDLQNLAASLWGAGCWFFWWD